jgi:hypothetical protein
MRFFPNFFLRDLLLWLGCLLALVLLATFLPYGPNIPGMEWDLGRKADPLAPAYPGIKPEWYFLWVYQLLKEFPPHLLGLEGPQVCLLVVFVLLGRLGVIPWIDGRRGPAVSRLHRTRRGRVALHRVSDPEGLGRRGPGRLAEDVRASGGTQRRRSSRIFAVVAGAAAARRWFVWSARRHLAALHELAGLSYWRRHRRARSPRQRPLASQLPGGRRTASG